MENDLAWTDNSDGDLLQYDFSPPSLWTQERVAAEQAAIAALLKESDPLAAASGPGWLRLAARLPGALRAALIAELLAGNRLTGIGSTGWPNDGSIVVNMRERFTAARQAPPPGVVWRESNDPHYAREELSQKVDSVESLIIT
jgi:hypothetical protein